MARPSSNIDKKLLLAGRRLIPKTGISGLKVRDVVKKAKVNLGMFHYHFGSRENYMKALIKEVYDGFISEFKFESETGKNPRENLRNALLSASSYIFNNRVFFTAFLEEIMKGNKALAGFASANMTRHLFIAYDLYRQGISRGYFREIPLPSLAALAIGTIAAPNIAARTLEKSYISLAGLPLTAALREAAGSPAMMEQRVDLLLNAISTGKNK